jgi:hypothetical protein
MWTYNNAHNPPGPGQYSYTRLTVYNATVRQSN